MALKFSNNASSLLAADISTAATTVTVTSGTGALFPTTADGTFLITVQDSTGNNEIMLCTARVDDSFTVTRAQEDTLARAFSAGAVVENRFTAGSINSFAKTSDVQPLDAGLTSISGLTTAADKIIYTTAADTYATASCTAAGRALLDDADAAAQRTTLGLVIGTDVQAYDAATVKSNAATAYTKPQRSVPVNGVVTNGVLNIDARATQDILLCNYAGTALTIALPTNGVPGDYITVTGNCEYETTLAWSSGWLGSRPTSIRRWTWYNFSARCLDPGLWLFLGMSEAE